MGLNPCSNSNWETLCFKQCTVHINHCIIHRIKFISFVRIISLIEMNQTTESLKKVYKKDGEGATYAVSQTVFEGQTVEFASGWPDMGRTLTEMKSFIPHDDDVMLITYPRSGMC